MEWNMDIVKAEFVVSNATVEKCPKPDRHEYAFIGRSNVGKSSLINMLTNNKKLAKTAAREDPIDQSLSDQRYVVYGGFARIWICPYFRNRPPAI